MVNLYTEFEVCIYSRYEDMKGGERCRKMVWFGVDRGHSGSLAMSTFDIKNTTLFNSGCIILRLAILVELRL